MYLSALGASKKALKKKIAALRAKLHPSVDASGYVPPTGTSPYPGFPVTTPSTLPGATPDLPAPGFSPPPIAILGAAAALGAFLLLRKKKRG